MKIDASLHAVVTGAASGLGQCFTQELLRAGARVVAGDIDQDGLELLAEDCQDLPGALQIQALDVADESSVKQFYEAATSFLPQMNVLINNAGILRDGKLVHKEQGWVRKLPTVQWRTVLDVNLTGPFFMARAFSAWQLERQHDGAIQPSLIVNISSITSAGNPGQSNYAASKAGLDADTRTWAQELAPYGIRVAGLAPGITETPILRNMNTEQLQALIERVPLKRIGQPREMWQALHFILECDYFNGRVMSVDGGADF